MEYGLLEFLGPLFRPIMRPLFTLPGRSAVDNLASFIGDGTVGVLITSRQIRKGIYSKRESIVISTTFSVVSIHLLLLLLKLLDYNKSFCILFNSNCFLLSCSDDHYQEYGH